MMQSGVDSEHCGELTFGEFSGEYLEDQAGVAQGAERSPHVGSVESALSSSDFHDFVDIAGAEGVATVGVEQERRRGLGATPLVHPRGDAKPKRKAANFALLVSSASSSSSASWSLRPSTQLTLPPVPSLSHSFASSAAVRFPHIFA